MIGERKAMDKTEPRAKFTAMIDSTFDDWCLIGAAAIEMRTGLADRIIDHLKLLDKDYGGFPVDRLEHCLQTATLAANDGRDDEYVVCALLHDIGDTLATFNHADLAATMLEPFVCEKNYWMVKHHGIFQGYYFFHHFGQDRNIRDQFAGHPYYDYTEEFCFKYDQKAFDPDYKSMPLSEFLPAVERLFAEPKKSIYVSSDSQALTE